MNVQGINKCPKPCFQAKLQDSKDVAKLTKYEVVEGRYKAYKNALKNLEEVHKGEVIDICQTSDGKNYMMVNRTTGNSGMIDYSANLTDAVNELARPTSKIHKDVFACNGNNETSEIRKEFYA